MEIVTVPIAAGETKSLHLAGDYFEVIEASAPIDVKLYHRQTGQSEATQIVAGVYMRIGFKEIQIKSITSQTVRVMVAEKEGGTRRLAGNVSINGTVPVEVQGTVQTNEPLNTQKLLDYAQWAALNDRLYVMAGVVSYIAIGGGEYNAAAVIANPAGSGKNLMIIKGSRMQSLDLNCRPTASIIKYNLVTAGTQRAYRTTQTDQQPAFAKAWTLNVSGGATITTVGDELVVANRENRGQWSAVTIEHDLVIKPGYALMVSALSNESTNMPYLDLKFVEME